MALYTPSDDDIEQARDLFEEERARGRVVQRRRDGQRDQLQPPPQKESEE